MECDACLDDAGAFSGEHYYDLRFPLAWSVEHHISNLEALNLIIALKSLVPESLRCIEVVIKTDNIASAYSLTTGRTKDPAQGPGGILHPCLPNMGDCNSSLSLTHRCPEAVRTNVPNIVKSSVQTRLKALLDNGPKN